MVTIERETDESQSTRPLLKLELACGQHKEPGWTGVDIVKTDAVDLVHDLLEFPWPFDDESVAEARASHFVEHIPHLCYCCRNQPDPFWSFFKELHRILVPGGSVLIITPFYLSERAWQDPTHRRAITPATYAYLNKDWLISQKLDHYGVDVDFEFPPAQFNMTDPRWLLADENTKQFAARYYNNVIDDLHVRLIKR